MSYDSNFCRTTNIPNTIHNGYTPLRHIPQIHNSRTDFNFSNDNERKDIISSESFINNGSPFMASGINQRLVSNMDLSPDDQSHFYSNSYPIFYQNPPFDQIHQYNRPTVTSPEIPSTTSFGGMFDFEVSFSQPEKETKSITWTYSALFHKVYVRPFSQCPFKFRCTPPVPEGYTIRAMAVYMKPEHVKEIVTRCPNHTMSDHVHSAPSHLVRCNDINALYLEDGKRQSVIVPFLTPQPGCDWLTYLYKFMCYGSCTGGLNRRPIQLVFTLENESFVVVGRKVVEVRVCACPGRDRRSNERSPRSFQSKRKKKINCPSPKSLKSYSNGGENEEFNLIVHGKSNFKFLKNTRDYLYSISKFTNCDDRGYSDCSEEEKIQLQIE